jgi:hypothetical protein
MCSVRIYKRALGKSLYCLPLISDSKKLLKAAVLRLMMIANACLRLRGDKTMKHSQFTRRDFLKVTCAGTIAAVVPFGVRAAQAKHRPNIVVILSDDQGWGDLRLHRNLNI